MALDDDDNDDNKVAVEPRRLGWGETPWDGMAPEQLLREVQRMYSALVSARSVLAQMQLGMQREYPDHPYWLRRGSGGDALAKVEQALAPYPNEPAYHSFFRYANDLLFEGLGFDWMICENGDLVGSYENKEHQSCTLCAARGKGVVPMRRITWEDLKPSPRPVSGATFLPSGPVG